MSGDDFARLRVLAGLYGVEPRYTDITGMERQASPEALTAVLRSLGAALHSPAAATDAIRARRVELASRIIEPVIVAWDGSAPVQEMRLPASLASGHADLALDVEGIGTRRARVDVAAGSVEHDVVEGEAFVRRKFRLPDGLPHGYHPLHVEAGGLRAESLVISAPPQAYGARDAAGARDWGIFVPLYALRTSRSPLCADLTDLARLLEWLHGRGGSVAATLPLLASFHQYGIDASPYAPVSRLFWNEQYLDVTAAPEYARCEQALPDPGNGPEVANAASTALVDHVAIMAAKRPVIEALAACADATELARFAAAQPRALDYAMFRAACERHGRPWTAWPAAMRDGRIGDGDVSPDAVRYHLYAQMLTSRQMDQLAGRARERGQHVYLDLPLGVHMHGYDAWRERGWFAQGVTSGAPPDGFFTQGQDWGFAPPHPERIRESGYGYMREYLRAHLTRATLLRLDHVMGLHRLFWVPEGFPATEGVYVSYRSAEQYAVHCLESQRAGARLVGENLGTVPPYVNEALRERGFLRMYVAQFEVSGDPQRALPEPAADSVASLNTHDVPPFAAFWHDADLSLRLNLGFAVESDAARQREARAPVREALIAFLRREGWLGEPASAHDILRAWLSFLAASPARFVLANLEDLWLEEEQQNMPGTIHEYPNWRRRARLSFEEFAGDPAVADLLAAIDRLRRDGSRS
ncbi:MAG TPA: 4-alpha-glucanotransferase [Dehalococcoidia bacterium]|nr:4-alpha-glucanotransferase [Dehalococcoidia bacterium]